MAGLSIRSYMVSVIWPIVKVSVLALPLPIFLSMNLESTFVNVVIVSFVSVLSVAITVYTIGLYKGEKEILKYHIQKRLLSFIGK